jgi:hypothetical protein
MVTDFDRNEKFKPGEPALMNALARIRDVLNDCGFRAQRARATESTLRVYLDSNRRPILNPRIMRNCLVAGRRLPAPVLTIDVWTDGSQLSRRQLRSFKSDAVCSFVVTGHESDFGMHEGFWAIPVQISATGEFSTKSDQNLASAARRIWFSLVPSAAP